MTIDQREGFLQVGETGPNKLTRIGETRRNNLGIIHSILEDRLGVDDRSVRRLGRWIDLVDEGAEMSRPYYVYGRRALELQAGLEAVRDEINPHTCKPYIYAQEAADMLAEIEAASNQDGLAEPVILDLSFTIAAA